MRDSISEQRIKLLHPSVRDVFKSFVEDAETALNVTLRVVQGLRTIDEQNELYAKGRTKPGSIVTNAKGGSSFHNYGLAIDLVELKEGKLNWNFKYENLLPYAEKYGLKWGGHFKSIVDKPHFEKSFGYTWRVLLDKYKAGDFIKDTKYVRI